MHVVIVRGLFLLCLRICSSSGKTIMHILQTTPALYVQNSNVLNDCSLYQLYTTYTHLNFWHQCLIRVMLFSLCIFLFFTQFILVTCLIEWLSIVHCIYILICSPIASVCFWCMCACACVRVCMWLYARVNIVRDVLRGSLDNQL